jgi:hypothetical protein
MYPTLLARGDSPDARTNHAHTTLAPHHARTTPHVHTTLVHHLLHTVSPSGEHNNQPDDDDGDG